MPARILGVPLSGLQDALSGVIAARERLARPLTIAIMGEFSSGKSTFINALLGEAVAPMGVLPDHLHDQPVSPRPQRQRPRPLPRR
jgi:ribosome biogenesis GTPase A